jgi:hypothetical protein
VVNNFGQSPLLVIVKIDHREHISGVTLADAPWRVVLELIDVWLYQLFLLELLLFARNLSLRDFIDGIFELILNVLLILMRNMLSRCMRR